MQKQRHKPRTSKHSPLIKLTRNLLRKVNRAFNEFNLIAEGDRVCVSVSGGKDSLSLMHLLIEHRRFFPMNYEIGAVHVVSDFDENAEKIRDYLAGVFESKGIPYGFVNISVTTDREGNPCEPSCFWCAWNRREAVFRYCVEHGYNKLAFGHHFDDVAETTLLNLIYHGTLETMLPRRTFFDGKFDVIRPLFYLRERETVNLANKAGFLSETCTCSRADTGKRRYMKNLIRELTRESKLLHFNLWRASRAWHETFGDHPLHRNEREETGTGKMAGDEETW